MIRFGLRLTLAGGREAAVRLGIIAVAVALGVAMLLAAIGAMAGATRQSDRHGWANAVATPEGPLWWQLRMDRYDGSPIARVDLAAAAPEAPVPPGLTRLPAPGEYFASPALARLLASEPADQLAARFPGTQAGTVGDAALPSPGSLVAVVGYTPEELASRTGPVRVASFPAAAPASCPGGCWSGIPAAGLQLIFGVVAAALIFPLLVLVGSATRLAAARREQRFAAMRLAGATPAQVGLVSVVESLVSALAGTAAGIGIFYACRSWLAAIPLTGEAMFPADLAPGLAGVAAVALGVPLASAAAAWLALRRVRISPLGVSRRVRTRAPRAYRLIPLGLGLAELGWFIGRRPPDAGTQVLAYMSGILVVMIGLVVAGPWLTMAGSRLLAARARRPAALIAARRLADDPRTAFRSVSGLVLALFVTSVAAGVMTTVAADRPAGGDRLAAERLFLPFRDEEARPTGAVARSFVATRTPPADLAAPEGFWSPDLLAACADITAATSDRPCAPGARTAWVYPDLTAPDEFAGNWPAADLDPARLTGLPVASVVVPTDGGTAAIERARTALVAAYPMLWGPETGADAQTELNALFAGWQRLADVVTVVSLGIAGLSLAVGVTGGLLERRRPFSLLRLTGVPLSLLRRIVALESVTPLLVTAVVAVAAGLFSAHLFARAQLSQSLEWPGVTFFAVAVLGLVAALAVIASTLPLLRRVTGPEAARNG